MSDWVRFHRELCTGEKLGLPRAVRFVYLELSLAVRAKRGFVVLPRGMSDVDAVHALIGGNRKELVEAIKVLSADDDPMIVFETVDGKRVLRVTNWNKWNPVDGTAAERQQRKRDKAREADRDVTRDGNDSDRDSIRDVTEPRARAQISSPLISSESSEGESERGSLSEPAETPCPDSLPADVMAELDGEAALAGWPNPKAEWPHFQAHCRSHGYLRADWREALRKWLMQGRKFADRDRARGPIQQSGASSPARKLIPPLVRPPKESANG